MSNLVLHSGGRLVSRDELAEARTPASTATHFPISHASLVAQTIDKIAAAGVRIVSEQHALAKDDARYFGMFGVAGSDGAAADDWGLLVGLRNSHDKSFRASLAIGTRVFVCDNLAFSGEVTIARMHTRHILRDLPKLMTTAVGKIVGQRESMAKRVEHYKAAEIDDLFAHDAMIRALDHGVISPPRLPVVLSEWRKPSHPEFEPRTAWSLFNAFTEAMKAYNLDSVYARTQPLHGLFDAATGLVSAKA